MKTRHVSEKIPLSEVPFIMRALGYYPTEQEVNKLHVHCTVVYMLLISLSIGIIFAFSQIKDEFTGVLKLLAH